MDAHAIAEIVAAAKVAGAALCGGIVRMFLRPAKSLTQTALLLLSCVIVGGFGAAPALAWFNLSSEWAGAMGAALGFSGLSVAQAILRGLDKLDLTEFFNRAAKP